MSVDVPALQNLVATISGGLGTAASATAPEQNQAALREALVGLEVLVMRLRDAEVLRPSGELPTIEKLEQQYGRALGRVIAALGGLPILASAGNATLARLLGEDTTVREAIANLNPERDAELLETLYDLFLPNRLAEARARRALLSPATSAAAQAAMTAAAKATYVIGTMAVPATTTSEPLPPDPDLAAENHVSGVRRVERTQRPRKR